MGRPRKKRPAPATTDAQKKKPSAPAKKAPIRTPQNCFEAAGNADSEDEATYEVERIVALRWVKGERQYLVKWVDYDESKNTWEPLGNLVGCAAQVREYELAREAEDSKEKEEVLARRQAAKERAEAHAAQLRRAALEAAAQGGGDAAIDVDDELDDADNSGDKTLKMHKGKSGIVWSQFDLTKEKTSCNKCLGPSGDVCGVVPSISGGTTNFWSHLWTHHKQVWYSLKYTEGSLTAAGKVEMEKLQATLQKMSSSTSSLNHRAGGKFLSAKLPPSAKSTLDRVTSEWIVDEDHSFNAASTDGFRAMMRAATSGVYDGCCEKTVKHHVYAMAVEGTEEVQEFHRGLLKSGLKPAASGDLWSKNGTALFGLVSHGIMRTVEYNSLSKPAPVWTMCEKLCGSVPCSEDRHTGEHIGELSDGAWAKSGLQKPIEEIFVRVSDNGANMLKGWEVGFQAPCCDHTLELSVKMYNQHPRISPTLEKGRGIVGYFNSSTVGYNEREVGLNKCQKSAGLPEVKLVQDVKTRWRSTLIEVVSASSNVLSSVLL